jgi:hypothetical protein
MEGGKAAWTEAAHRTMEAAEAAHAAVESSEAAMESSEAASMKLKGRDGRT